MRGSCWIASVAGAGLFLLGSVHGGHGAFDAHGVQYGPIAPPEPIASFGAADHDYPPISVQLQEEGLTDLEVLVGADGKCKDAKVVKSSGKRRLDEASISLCKRKFRWTPAMLDGQPVEATVKTTVTWRLR